VTVILTGADVDPRDYNGFALNVSQEFGWLLDGSWPGWFWLVFGGWTPLYRAANHGHCDIAEVLLESRALLEALM
jgi:hypothetical protein